MDESWVPDAALAHTRRVFEEALRVGDAGAAAEVYATDARLVSPSADVVAGRAAIAAFWSSGLGAGVSGVELEALELRGHGRLAFEVGRYELRLEAEGQGPLTDRGAYVLVHERQADGAWLRAVESFTPDPLPAAGRQQQGAAQVRPRTGACA